MKLKLLITLALLTVTTLMADDTVEEIKLLRKQVDDLSHKLKQLEEAINQRPLGETSVKPDAGKKETAFVSAGLDGFYARSADTNFLLRVFGYGQFDGRFYAGESPAHDTFLIRRMRLGLEGTVYKYYDYKILTDFGSGITSTERNNAFLQDAYVNFHYRPELQLQLGKFKVPVSLEVLQSDTKILFVERGLPTQLAPNRDVGIQIHGDVLDARLNYALGIFNGVADGGSGDNEPSNSGKHFAGRFLAQPFRHAETEPLRGLTFGVGGSYGDQGETPAGFLTPGRQRFFNYAEGPGTNAATANIVANGEHWRIAPQGFYYYGRFGVFAEYIISAQSVRRFAEASTSFVAENRAWNVAASYVFTGEKNSHNRIVPLHPVDFTTKGWGAWELAARFGELSVDRDVFSSISTADSSQRITAWEIGLNWYLNRNVKFNFDYSQSHFNGGKKNPGSVNAQDEKVFLGRTQFSF